MNLKTLKLIIAAAAVLPAFAGAGVAMAADRNHPTVVELFQSQGCSSCPPANANLMRLSDRPDLLTLSFGVTYWDQLGWKDTFASPQYTARQWDYAHAFHRDQVFTPQVVVNGRSDGVGIRLEEIEDLVRRNDRGDSGPALTVSQTKVQVGAFGGANHAGQVLLVRYDPSIEQVPIHAGENGGRTLPHRNVVKQLVRLGAWSGASMTYDLPPAPTPGLATAVLVQAGSGGPIIAAVRGG
jgi:hypothetical protein